MTEINGNLKIVSHQLHNFLVPKPANGEISGRFPQAKNKQEWMNSFRFNNTEC